MALIDINSFVTTRSKDTCLTSNSGQTESICSAIVLIVHRGVSTKEVINAICQTDRLWGFRKKDRGHGAISECWNVLIEIQRRETEKRFIGSSQKAFAA